MAALVVLALALAAGWALWQPRADPPASASTPPPASASATTPGSGSGAAQPPAAPAAFAALVGNWQRPDGGYVLSVSGVDEDGRATVSYFNPRPIHVARAAARQADGAAQLFVEFDDVNYPGSTYTLAYDSASDQLKGDYYQAVQQAHYEVFFVRQP